MEENICGSQIHISVLFCSSDQFSISEPGARNITRLFRNIWTFPDCTHGRSTVCICVAVLHPRSSFLRGAESQECFCAMPVSMEESLCPSSITTILHNSFGSALLHHVSFESHYRSTQISFCKDGSLQSSLNRGFRRHTSAYINVSWLTSNLPLVRRLGKFTLHLNQRHSGFPISTTKSLSASQMMPTFWNIVFNCGRCTVQMCTFIFAWSIMFRSCLPKFTGR